ncbi:LOW QUALITY PROTEIN: hypothetical protein OSB04_016383 [Centaurea solstitialis]|uniref:Reverse transcriptase domain-containing protein n=1 Tax=Centaurea solstitialis TaxID=347529 RepID=A0AA38TKV3_9ASTR|nr:LOW QUALITY PROTEIN: hypothetical protein OSB04_016383 [Centaurea solstitialis]
MARRGLRLVSHAMLRLRHAMAYWVRSAAISHALKNAITSPWLPRLEAWRCRHATPHAIWNLVVTQTESDQVVENLAIGIGSDDRLTIYDNLTVPSGRYDTWTFLDYITHDQVRLPAYVVIVIVIVGASSSSEQKVAGRWSAEQKAIGPAVHGGVAPNGFLANGALFNDMVSSVQFNDMVSHTYGFLPNGALILAGASPEKFFNRRKLFLRQKRLLQPVAGKLFICRKRFESLHAQHVNIYKLRPTLKSSFFRILSEAQKNELEVPFSEQEVKNVVWSCGHNKATGPDGFTFEFLRKFWGIVGRDFLDAVKYFESNPLIKSRSNSSFVTLIPKVSDPLTLADFRPISLIGCVSKVISKVLAERLKGVLDSVVSNSQTAFIKGRSILDGPLMVNKLISWARKKRKKLLLFKVDFAKAFETLNWNYLDGVLLQMGFGDKWRSWVKGCICTAKASVLINGSPSKEFNLNKGVRQGDPLAPFLFILAAEGLTVAMKDARQNNHFKGVCLNNSEDEVSIFQFADDAIFVGDWSLANAKNLICILKCFEVCSGLTINMSKSCLMGLSVSKEEITRIANQLKCKEESIPFVYLGLPVGGNTTRVASWQPLINKFKEKLSSWKAKTLSFGGRLCLCKSVLGTLGNYLFSLYKVPPKVINLLESLRSRFFWGWTDDKKKINWLAWNKVISDKHVGGLGIGSLRALNLTLLFKWRWRELTEIDVKWQKVNRIRGVEKDIADLGINISSLLQRKDDERGWSWELEANKIYSVRSLRKLIDGISTYCKYGNRLDPTASQQNKYFHLACIASEVCPSCLSADENIDHLLTTCSTSKLLSALLVLWVDWWPGNECTVSGVWSTIRSIGGGSTQKVVRSAIGAAFFWCIWEQQNRMVFNTRPKKEIDLFRDVLFLAFDWVRSRVKGCKYISWDCWVRNPLNIKDVILHAYIGAIWSIRNGIVFNQATMNASRIANDIQADAFFWVRYRSNFGRSLSWLDWCCFSFTV